MVTLRRIGNSPNVPVMDFVGLSKDEKPIEKIYSTFIINGSTFKEIDTGNVYIYDGENKTWVLCNSGSGSSSGGGNTDFCDCPDLSGITPEEVEDIFSGKPVEDDGSIGSTDGCEDCDCPELSEVSPEEMAEMFDNADEIADGLD